MRGAAALGDVDRVRELAAANPALLRENNSRTGGLLTLATNHGQLEVVRLLLDLGCDPDERLIIEAVEEPTLSWGSPLWYAAFGGRLEIARLLLDRGADPNANVYASGWPLRNAYQQKDEAMKRLLIERGAKMQPYMVAEAGDVQAARRLLEEDPGEEMAQELTWAAACHGKPGVIEIALPYLAWKPDDSRWNWILIQPIRGIEPDGEDHAGFFEAMKLLLDRPMDPNVGNRLRQTVLHFAAADQGPIEEERARFTAMLLDHGARIDVRDELLQSTPLGWACRWGRKPMAELLIARGAPVNEPDAPEWATPLAWATKMGHQEVAARLVEHGAVS